MIDGKTNGTKKISYFNRSLNRSLNRCAANPFLEMLIPKDGLSVILTHAAKAKHFTDVATKNNFFSSTDPFVSFVFLNVVMMILAVALFVLANLRVTRQLWSASFIVIPPCRPVASSTAKKR